MSIQKLDEDLITKIAAGEVVERPASVVKELVENALDALAQSITVRIEHGGVDLIEVQDDGCGITKDDLNRACVRHATSKITRVQDLFRISSLGFRGEALASISSVSSVIITSRHAASDTGWKAEYTGESLRSIEPLACPRGTTVSVRNLFSTVPVRLKFLKTKEVETSHIVDIITRYALINPGVRFQLVIDGKQQLSSFGNTTKDVAASLFGARVSRELVEINTETVKGYLGKPVISRKDKNQMFVFVNGRSVKDRILTNAVLEGYDTLLFTGRYPVVVLNFILPQEAVDVNVHPQKLQIKLRNEREVFQRIKEGIASVLRGAELIYNTEHVSEFQSMLKRPDRAPQVTPAAVHEPVQKHKYFTTEMQAPLSAQAPIPRTLKAPPPKKPYRVIGQFNKTYIMVEEETGLLILDQHAAHERVLYEHFTQLHQDPPAKQELLEPIVIQLSPAEKNMMESFIEIADSWGFVIEAFGPSSVVIRTIPVVLGKPIDPHAIKDALLETSLLTKSTSEAHKQRAIATMACRAAIKAGDLLTMPFIQALVDKIYDLDMNSTCPHGRPTALRMSPYDFEKLFKRKA